MKKLNLPGPNAVKMIERDREVISPSYPRGYPFAMDHGKGTEVWDVDGNRFLDSHRLDTLTPKLSGQFNSKPRNLFISHQIFIMKIGLPWEKNLQKLRPGMNQPPPS